jgi:hypothetical protein
MRSKKRREKKMGSVFGEKMTTPTGRVSFPYVFEKAASLEAGKEGKYEVTLYIPKSEDISKLRANLEKVAREAFGAKFQSLEKLKHPPIKDGDDKDPSDPAYGHWIIRAKSAKRPLVVDASRSPIESKEAIYGGCFGRINVTPASYAIPTGWGVTLYLNAVQKVKDGERFGGGGVSAEEVFEALSVDASEDDTF